MAHSFVIREATIGGESVIPFYLGYINALNHGMFTLLVVRYTFYDKRYVLLVFSFLFFLNIVLNDMLTFGRIGVLYAIFIILSLFFLKYGRQLLRLRYVIYATLLFFILNLPRIIRGGGDNFSSTLDKLEPYMLVKVPEIFNIILANYIYYFSSPVAFSVALDDDLFPNTVIGERLFTPVYNLFARLFDIERVNTIDPSVFIPYKTNIFTILYDVYTDLGEFFFIYPIILGLFVGYISKTKRFITKSVYVFMLAFMLYSPLYNAFSFGVFTISLLFLLMLSFLFEFGVK